MKDYIKIWKIALENPEDKNVEKYAKKIIEEVLKSDSFNFEELSYKIEVITRGFSKIGISNIYVNKLILILKYAISNYHSLNSSKELNYLQGTVVDIIMCFKFYKIRIPLDIIYGLNLLNNSGINTSIELYQSIMNLESHEN